jgi:hypothetical protein
MANRARIPSLGRSVLRDLHFDPGNIRQRLTTWSDEAVSSDARWAIGRAPYEAALCGRL